MAAPVVKIRQATPQEVDTVSCILLEAARWLEQARMRLWREEELVSSRVAPDVDVGLFFIAECSGEVAGTVKFQLDDPLYWPDAPRLDAAYIHRLAVRRRYAGTGLSTTILQWAAQRTRSIGRNWLRLDCQASRPRLRSVYESFGFRHHSDRQVGLYFVARYEYDVRQ